MPNVEVNGTSLDYTESGTGQPVVFVHGGISDLRTWTRQMDAIGGKYHAVAYSRRYARPNEDIPDGVDDQMMPHVEDLAAFIRALGLAPVHLVGNSWGAFICLLVARDHRGLVRTLTLCEPPLLPMLGLSTPPKPFQMLRLLMRRPRTAFAVAQLGIKTLQAATNAFKRGDDEAGWQTFAKGVLGAQTFNSLPEERKRQMSENVKALRAQLLGAGFPPFSERDARSIDVPTLLVTGERSPAVLHRITDRLERLLPRAEVVRIDDASHVMHEEQPQGFNQAVLNFLSRHSG